MNLIEIGIVEQNTNHYFIKLHKKYVDGITSIEGFSHLKIVWWAENSEIAEYENGVIIKKPYTKGPDSVGVFATRSQIRPNPVCITTVMVKDIDYKKGIISTYFIDALPGSSVLDIKPYLPSNDIVKNFAVPSWCSHWPKNLEEAADFDWESEFNF